METSTVEKFSNNLELHEYFGTLPGAERFHLLRLVDIGGFARMR